MAEWKATKWQIVFKPLWRNYLESSILKTPSPPYSLLLLILFNCIIYYCKQYSNKILTLCEIKKLFVFQIKSPEKLKITLSSLKAMSFSLKLCFLTVLLLPLLTSIPHISLQVKWLDAVSLNAKATQSVMASNDVYWTSECSRTDIPQSPVNLKPPFTYMGFFLRHSCPDLSKISTLNSTFNRCMVDSFTMMQDITWKWVEILAILSIEANYSILMKSTSRLQVNIL